MPFPGRGKLQVTGTVGPMTRESEEVAMTWVRSNAKRLADAARLHDSTDIHVHPRPGGRGRTRLDTCGAAGVRRNVGEP